MVCRPIVTFWYNFWKKSLSKRFTRKNKMKHEILQPSAGSQNLHYWITKLKMYHTTHSVFRTGQQWKYARRSEHFKWIKKWIKGNSAVIFPQDTSSFAYFRGGIGLEKIFTYVLTSKFPVIQLGVHFTSNRSLNLHGGLSLYFSNFSLLW